MTDASARRSGHPISAAGIVLTTISALLFVALWLLDAAGMIRNAYVGLFAFVALPALFVIGLLLIPCGWWLARRRERRGLPALPMWPRVDLNDRRTRRLAFLLVAGTIVNVLILAAAGVQAVHYMDSPAFCGELCHTPMAPQYVRWRESPHAKIDCVACHVGSEPGGFIKAKLAGTRRLAHMITGGYPRPIRAAHGAVPAPAFTCEQCHDTTALTGDRLRVIRTYADDESSTPSDTTLRLHVGAGPAGSTDGVIHWHAQPGRTIEYVASDAQGDVIPWVRVTEADGRARTYVTEQTSADAPPAGERRRMDCLSCHNRPAHQFPPSVERAVDNALARGQLAGGLPYLRREAVKALTAVPESQAQADGDEAIARSIRGFYAREHPDVASTHAGEVDRIVRSLQALRAGAVFPAMRVSWPTYVSRLGHTDSPGCFRCHDDEHKAADGGTIRQECTLCHAMPE